MSLKESPTFNLKAVVQETGLKPDTLRVWERRYGLPQPDRTDGGHRVYSPRDIEILKWLIARQEEGLSISRAVKLWHKLVSEGKEPLKQQDQPVAPGVNAIQPANGEALAELRKAWVSACLAFDEQQADYVITQAFALYPPEVACTELLLKGIAHLGTRWLEGKVTIQQEHFASALAVRRLEALLAATPAPTRAARLLVCCPPQEEHILSPLMLSLLLRRSGWNVLYLGSNVPLDRLETTLTSTQTDLVISSAQQLYTAATLKEMAQLVQQVNVPLAYGGHIFNQWPALRQQISGHFLGNRLDNVTTVVEQLLASPPALADVEPISAVYQAALEHYREYQSRIEAEVWQMRQSSQISHRNLSVGNIEMAKNIIAALSLGGLEFLGTNLTWLTSALGDAKLGKTALFHYLKAYHQAVDALLDSRGAPLKAWLANAMVAVDASKKG